jgi:hypothetical protein
MPPKKGETDVNYKGLVIRWTGWKSSMGQACLVGQWAARISENEAIFSGTNGICGRVPFPMGHMNISIIPDFNPSMIHIFSTAHDKAMAKQTALAVLIEYIDAHERNSGGQLNP